MILPLLIISYRLIQTFACVPSLPPPNDKCCNINILDQSSLGHSVFDPELHSCPQDALFICSVKEPGSQLSTVITINGIQTIVTPNGVNSRITLRCDLNNNIWYYERSTESLPVSTVGCQNQ